MGIFGDRASNLAAQNSDLIIALGSKLSVPQIGYKTKAFAQKTKKIFGLGFIIYLSKRCDYQSI